MVEKYSETLSSDKEAVYKRQIIISKHFRTPFSTIFSLMLIG